MNEDSKREYGTLIAKKSERLVTALYLVTDLISDGEPLKHAMRKNAVVLLSSMNALAQLDVKDRVTEFKISLKAVTEIASLLHVAVTTGIVSEMNGEILMEGFRSLQLVLEKKQPILTKEMLTIDNEKSLSEDPGFTSAITSTSYDILTPLNLARFNINRGHEDLVRSNPEGGRQTETLSKPEIREAKGQDVVPDKTQSRTITSTSVRDISAKGMTALDQQHKIPSSFSSSFQMRKNGRRDQILALFVKGVDVSIKDIAARIRGCSEKTIQRELNALLYDNVIERIGEKRWSRYILR